MPTICIAGNVSFTAKSKEGVNQRKFVELFSSRLITFRKKNYKIATAISRKVVGKNVYTTIPKGNMRYEQYTVPDIVAVEPTFVAFL